jgi:hypothetical protein
MAKDVTRRIRIAGCGFLARIQPSIGRSPPGWLAERRLHVVHLGEESRKAWEKAQRDGNPIPLPPAGTAIKPHE